MVTDVDNQAIVFALEPHPVFDDLCRKLSAQKGQSVIRQFPDGESYLRIETDVDQRPCIIFADLSAPNNKILPLIFLSTTLTELGTSKIGLVAPYLSYMRQDRRFKQGEAVTSRVFAALLSQQVDWLITIDPHLHRYHSLNEIYSIPCHVVKAAGILSEWLKTQEKVFLVGPDAESEQWVSKIASKSGQPFIIGSKQRHGDRDVTISLPDLSDFKAYTAIIIDDVISSGHTITSCIKELRKQAINDIKCIAVHGIFENNIDQVLLKNGLTQLITTNTIPHATNRIDITDLLVMPILNYLQANN